MSVVITVSDGGSTTLDSGRAKTLPSKPFGTFLSSPTASSKCSGVGLAEILGKNRDEETNLDLANHDILQLMDVTFVPEILVAQQ